MKISRRGGQGVLALTVACARLYANDYFVAPTGTPTGLGTLAKPYDLLTPLSGLVGQPGDTFWLRGGNYSLGHVNTQVQGAPGAPITFRPVTGESARIDGSISIFGTGGFVVLRDFELYSSDTNRVSGQTNVGFSPTDITLLSGIASYASNVSFINLVVHDQTRHGIYTDHSASVLVYGCLLFNNGWVSPDNAEGHGLYAQGHSGTSTLAENIVCNNSGASMHIYQSDPGLGLSGITMQGNVAFNAGAIQQVRVYRDWIIGVDPPATAADDIVLRQNMGYEPLSLAFNRELQLGRGSTNGSVVLEDNYMPMGLLMNNWRQATVTGNLFAPAPTTYVINLNQALTTLNADWDNNFYVCDPTGGEVWYNGLPYSFAGWQLATVFDWDSTFVVGELHGAKVFVRPNLYEPGRANITVYNWDNLARVSVDVSSVLPLNWGFEVRNAQNYLAGPVLSGVYHGQRLQLPMNNLTVAAPTGPLNGPLAAAPPTGPTFNVFLLLPRPNALQVTNWKGSVQVSWPVSAGAGALQWTPSVAGSGGWTGSTSSPVVVGDRYMITEPASPGGRFYRLYSP